MKRYLSIIVISVIALAGCAGGGGLDLEGTDTDPAVVEDPGWGDVDGEDGADLSPADEETAPVADTASGSLAIKGTVSSTLTQFQTFEKTIRAEGGSGSYDWSIVEGKLPDGITLQEKEGDKIKVKGVASKDGTFEGKIRVYDLEEEKFAEKPFDITVNEGKIVVYFPGTDSGVINAVFNQCRTLITVKSDLKSGEDVNSVPAGVEKTYKFEVTGGKPPYVWQSVSSVFDINLIPSSDTTKLDVTFKHSAVVGAEDELTVKVKDSCEGRDYTNVTYKFSLNGLAGGDVAGNEGQIKTLADLQKIIIRMKAGNYCGTCESQNYFRAIVYAKHEGSEDEKMVAITNKFLPSNKAENKWRTRDESLQIADDASDFRLDEISRVDFYLDDFLGKKLYLNVGWFELYTDSHFMSVSHPTGGHWHWKAKYSSDTCGGNVAGSVLLTFFSGGHGMVLGDCRNKTGHVEIPEDDVWSLITE